MTLSGKSVVVTGAARGLGAALGAEVLARGAARVVLIDRSEGVEETAAAIGALAVVADLSTREGVGAALTAARERVGDPDVYIGNAGVMGHDSLMADDSAWDLAWRLHVMTNVWAGQTLLPAMVERGSGHFALTASSAALSPNAKSAPYAVTKSAQLALAEWLAAQYRPQGVGVSCFCPGGMDTDMLRSMSLDDGYSAMTKAEADTPEEAARTFLDGIEGGEVLITTKQRSRDQLLLRGTDHEAWIRAAESRFHSLQ